MNGLKKLIAGIVLVTFLAPLGLGAEKIKDESVGHIYKTAKGKILLEVDDKLIVVLKKGYEVQKGDRLMVYKIMEDLINSGMEKEEEIHELVPQGVIEIVKVKMRRRAVARVVEISGFVQIGGLLKPQ